MYKHILIPVALDHEGIVSSKIAVARRLLAEGGKITLLTVLEEIPGFVAEFVDSGSENHLTSRIKEKLEAAADGAKDVSTQTVSGKPGVQIAEFARQNQIDLIVVGSHKPGVKDYFLGSTASRVSRRAPCAVFILRPDDD
ncbi:universal stress protein [Cohaesibacter gelatinilyticus]|uniref:Nucleotide-binding universal stress protein, UspA family n=1 Tax=Cohaesibacter gelatinilyticus TaxID=372072 RepID=A0A285PHH6_9HYPH|nr:universal stress protein [Cohaesibacter gelatinilyticus]SNZ21179.1 Nucleotide-binding universal stress protein, UspA family [Cohaesibacter gelatinilyticus]